MTTLAQLHDCHSCNDERSIVQKKKLVFALFPPCFLCVFCMIHRVSWSFHSTSFYEAAILIARNSKKWW